jgi:hypothetical protein
MNQNRETTDRARAGAWERSSGRPGPAAPAGKEMAMPLQIYAFGWLGKGHWSVCIMEKIDGHMKVVREGVRTFSRMAHARDFVAAKNQEIADARLAGREFKMPGFGQDWR